MLFAVLFSLAIAGQSAEVPRDCRDDNGTDRCAAENRAAVLKTFGLASIEDEAVAGVETYRASFIDGYGNELPTVSFERRPGQDPTVVVYGAEGRKMSSPVAVETWARVRSQSVFADRTLEPLPQPVRTGPDGRPLPPFPPMCLHAWVTTVEMANSTPDGRTVVPTRRITQGTCGGNLGSTFAFMLADEAVKAIPPCGMLDGTQQRNTVTILETCLGLKGDRFSAAELRNRVRSGSPRQGLDLLDAGVWRAYLGTNGSPELTWAGEVIRTDRGSNNRVAEFVVAQLKARPSLTFRPVQFEGRTGREAVIQGVVSYQTGVGAEAQWYRAAYRQTWVWDPNLFDWMVSTWVIEPFTPAAP